jgi:hypothetical protein
MSSMKRDVQLVVEDELSGVVLRKLVEQSSNGLSVHNVLSTGGFGKIKNRIDRFKNACNIVPHIILTDLDRGECAPSLLKDWNVGAGTQNFLFRIAVREVEAWLLADREGFAEYLNLPLAKMPQHPEQENDPKQTLFSLVRKCKKRRLVDELLPAIGSSASIGPLYNIKMGNFVRDSWSIQRAAINSDSLSRAIKRISTF